MLPVRVVLGVGYRGRAYQGWQSQPSGQTVQDQLEKALALFACQAVRTVCAGRTDAGVHGLNQVVHFDTELTREPFSWVRGTNRFLPEDIAVQWCAPVPQDFHARNSALGRRYLYVLLESAVRPALETGLVGWVCERLDASAMRSCAAYLLGEHDFSAFRSAECQAASPVKILRDIRIEQRGAYWRFEFDASSFLHHMVRNIMGCLVAVGAGGQPPGWMAEVLASRERKQAAPTWPAAGLYFAGPYYHARYAVPTQVPAMDWLP